MIIPRVFPDGTMGTARRQAPQVSGNNVRDMNINAKEFRVNSAGYHVKDYPLSKLEEITPTQIEIRTKNNLNTNVHTFFRGV